MKVELKTGEDEIIVRFDTLSEESLESFEHIRAALADKHGIYFIRWTVDNNRYWEGHLKPSLSGLTNTKLLKILHKILDEEGSTV